MKLPQMHHFMDKRGKTRLGRTPEMPGIQSNFVDQVAASGVANLSPEKYP
jgi:hypothetical protein